MLRNYTSLVNPSVILLVLNPYSKAARTGIKSYRPRDLNPVVDRREAAAPPPCGVMDRDSTGDTPSVMCPRQAAGYPNNFRNQAIRVSNPEPLKDPAHDYKFRAGLPHRSFKWSKSPFMSGNQGARNSSESPVRGWANLNRSAWSA